MFSVISHRAQAHLLPPPPALKGGPGSWRRTEPVTETTYARGTWGIPMTMDGYITPKNRSTSYIDPQFIPKIHELIPTSMTARNRPFPGPGPLKKLWLTGQRGWGRWCLLVSRVRGPSWAASWMLFGIRKGHVNPQFCWPWLTYDNNLSLF